MWKQIEGFDNYEVSDMGQVRNKKSGRVLKQGTKPNGVYYESHAEASRRTGVPVDSLNRAVRNGKTDLNGFNLTY